LLSTTTHTVFLRCHVSKKTYEIPDYIQIYVTTEYSREKKTLNKASDSDFVSYKVAKVSKESVLRRDRYTSWAEYSEERTIVIPMDSVENIADNPEKMFSISLHDDSNNKYIIDVPGSYFRDFLCFVRAWASSRGTTIVESSDAP